MRAAHAAHVMPRTLKETRAVVPLAAAALAAGLAPPPAELAALVPLVLSTVILRHLPSPYLPRSTSPSRKPSPQETLEDVRQLGDGGVGIAFTLLDGPRDAAARMVFQQDEADLVQRGPHGRNLDEDVHAVLVLFHHALYAPHLSLDAAQALEDRLFVLLVGCHGTPPPHAGPIHIPGVGIRFHCTPWTHECQPRAPSGKIAEEGGPVAGIAGGLCTKPHRSRAVTGKQAASSRRDGVR